MATTVVKLLDAAIGTETVAEGSGEVSVRKWAAQVRKDHGAEVKFRNRQEGGGAVDSVIATNSRGETVGVYNRKTGFPTVYEPKPGVAETVSANHTTADTAGAGAGMTASYQRRENQPIAEDYLEERRSR